jgi:hypothetical protein
MCITARRVPPGPEGGIGRLMSRDLSVHVTVVKLFVVDSEQNGADNAAQQWQHKE